jgi:hypothetical protein
MRDLYIDYTLKKLGGKMWIGFNWLRMEFSEELL